MGSINVLFQASGVHSSKQQRSWLTLATSTIYREKFHGKNSGTPGIEPGTAGCEARTLPLCYAVPPWNVKLFVSVTDGQDVTRSDVAATARVRETHLLSSHLILFRSLVALTMSAGHYNYSDQRLFNFLLLFLNVIAMVTTHSQNHWLKNHFCRKKILSFLSFVDEAKLGARFSANR